MTFELSVENLKSELKKLREWRKEKILTGLRMISNIIKSNKDPNCFKLEMSFNNFDDVKVQNFLRCRGEMIIINKYT